ncbi:hypothetical protein AbraIFM66950_011656 [Aspergillus brasiliensis]|nr:hypothetical protein AbraIFM66950_011656 [Aspergillus brasiliensis]
MSTEINYTDPLTGTNIDNLIDQTLRPKGIQSTLRHASYTMKIYGVNFDSTHPQANRNHIDNNPYQRLFISINAALALANLDSFTEVFSLCGIDDEHCKGPFPPFEQIMSENRSAVYHFHVRANLSQRVVIVPDLLLDGLFLEQNIVDTSMPQQ